MGSDHITSFAKKRTVLQHAVFMYVYSVHTHTTFGSPRSGEVFAHRKEKKKDFVGIGRAAAYKKACMLTI